MRVSGTCRSCGRRVLAFQVAEAGGRCPVCGHRFHPHYGPLLVQALKRLDAAGTALEDAIGRVVELGSDFELDPASLLEPLEERLGPQVPGRQPKSA
jgi:tRNA G26 N,N-dimethylase Trm1